MDLTITPKERAELATLCGVHEQYLYQCLTARKSMEADAAVECEQKSGGRLRRWMLRKEWWKTWPELIGSDGAPEVPPAAEPEGQGEVAKAV